MATLAIDASTAQALQLLLKLQKDYGEDGIKKLLFGPLSVESTLEKPPDNPDPKVVIQILHQISVLLKKSHSIQILM